MRGNGTQMFLFWDKNLTFIHNILSQFNNKKKMIGRNAKLIRLLLSVMSHMALQALQTVLQTS